ncbi:ISAs1 family transposase [Streptomyces sp. NPDC097727]|uniref:ISAs1 family transposase n=1 Tax=Streptomyces sp. NPDC097727 TaxID=3366092 RepID=UPI0038120861
MGRHERNEASVERGDLPKSPRTTGVSMCRQSATVCLIKSPALEDTAGLSPVERLRLLPDPRRRRGVRHPFVAVLLVAASAVVAGARSYTAIGQWSANAPQHALARLGARGVGALSVRVGPSAATIRRVVGLVCPGGLADLTGAPPAGSDSVAIDGKAARGSRHGQTPAAHLLAAMTGDGRTVTQLRVPDKTNEIICFAALLAPFDLTGVTVTADALHTQRAHARFLVDEKKAHYLLVVKANQPELRRRLRSLPWKDVTARRYDQEIGHGRRETWVTRALTVTDLGLDFPHAAQAVRILRHRTDRTTGTVSRQTFYAITDLTSHQASPQRTRSPDFATALGPYRQRFLGQCRPSYSPPRLITGSNCPVALNRVTVSTNRVARASATVNLVSCVRDPSAICGDFMEDLV